MEENEIKKPATKKKTTNKKKYNNTKKSTAKTVNHKVTNENKDVKPVIEKEKEPVVEVLEEEAPKESDFHKEIPTEDIPKESDVHKVLPIEEDQNSSIEEEKPIEETPVQEQENRPVTREEKKKPSFVIYLLIILFLICMGFVWYLALHLTDYQQGSFTEIGTFQEKMIFTDYLIVDDIYELEDYFPNKTFSGLNFDNHVYAVIEVVADSCSESNFRPVGYQIIEKTVRVQIEYEASCGVCAPEYLYYLLELDRDYQYDGVHVDYKAVNNPHCDPNVAYKPIIYLYPKETTNVSVQLGREEVVTVTYPEYKKGWNVIAHSDGMLQLDGREYYGLFWEGEEHFSYVHDDGFVVKGEDTVSFLEEKLSILGLNDKEANEFIIYWYPQLKKNPYNYIYFETEEEIKDYMPLTIKPTPDHVIRIQMDYKPLTEPINVKEQKLISPKREGFVAVEWGGSIIKD